MSPLRRWAESALPAKVEFPAGETKLETDKKFGKRGDGSLPRKRYHSAFTRKAGIHKRIHKYVNRCKV